jgi:CubicO group peptidase (beta-lactamase class C family)
MLAFVYTFALGMSGDRTDFGQRVMDAVTPILASQALLYNTSYSLGVAHNREGAAAGEFLGVAKGVQDHRTGEEATVDSTYPVGSANKPLTAVALMTLAESGVLDLDAPAYKLIDPFLNRTNGTTLLELWGGDTRIELVTGRQLIGMRAGVFDYEYYENEKWSLDPANNGVDLTPNDYIRNDDMFNRSIWYTPGEGGAYSSMGFVLAGYMLAAWAESATWEDYDMRRAWADSTTLSDAAKARLEAGLTFPRGACSDHPRVVRQYYTTTTKLNATYRLAQFRDMSDEGCLNGT